MHGPRITLSVLLAGLRAIGVAAPFTDAAVAQGRYIDVATMALGGPPPGFGFQRTGQGPPGQWTVVADPTAAGGRAIEQSSTDRASYRFPLAIYPTISARNVEVTIRFKAVSGEVDRAGGVAVRVVSPDDYYVVRANALEDNVRLYRVVQGRREQIATADVKVSAGEWHSLRLKAENDRFTVSFDGQTLYSVSDSTIGEAAAIALWTKADSVTRFDAIVVRLLD